MLNNTNIEMTTINQTNQTAPQYYTEPQYPQYPTEQSYAYPNQYPSQYPSSAINSLAEINPYYPQQNYR